MVQKYYFTMYCINRCLSVLLICLFTITGHSRQVNKTIVADSVLHPWHTNAAIVIRAAGASFDSIQLDIFFKKYPVLKKYASQVRGFYRKRNYTYIWYNNDELIKQATILSARMLNLQNEGVFVHISYQREFDSMLQRASLKIIKKQVDVMLELMLTTQYFVFAKFAWQGMGSSVVLSAKWHLPRKLVDYGKYLDDIVNSSPDRLPANEPVYRQYELLRKFLVEYRALDAKEKWQAIPAVKRSIKPGDSSLVIALVKARLYKLGDYKGDTTNNFFDIELLTALTQFQQRHGLKTDSLIGKETITELNVPLKNRVTQILVNMERTRWLPVFVNTDYVAVNIPEFRLHVYHGDSVLWNCNVVVGKTVHPTSVFYGEIKYVVFSPYWNVPKSIVVNEILPAIHRNSGYMAAHNMEVTGHEGGLPVIRQRPGPTNPLGLVKFLFPNSYNIYLHDTPTKSLFGESTRAFSHGCIRIAEPVKMANFLLRNDKEWDSLKIDAAMHLGKEQYVTLDTKVPVFIAYVTAFVDRNGRLNFRKDIYHLDENLAKMIVSGNGVY